MTARVVERKAELVEHGPIIRDKQGQILLTEKHVVNLRLAGNYPKAIETRVAATESFVTMKSGFARVEDALAKIGAAMGHGFLDLRARVQKLETIKREDFPDQMKLDADLFLQNHHGYRGRCPGPGSTPGSPCREVLIQPGGSKRAEWVEFDHFDNDRSNNRRDNCWPLCTPCHALKKKDKSPGMKTKFRRAFDAFQGDFSEWTPITGSR